jgi:UDP-MurNAc hydroxylase
MSDLTTFKILSHACMLIKRGSTHLIIDPWLVGSCYWRSWWNYPEPEVIENELNQVTHVLISHIHWDHWHGQSLKKYFKGRQFFLADEPKTRSYDDLVRLRLGDVNLLKHGKTICLGDDIKITIYQFGLFQNDSVIVIETPEVKILNANDAKVAGLVLQSIMKKHGPFDFALRSHSTANYRACISVVNDHAQMIDDNVHYSRSFKLFMDAVNPKYAIPFASNNCHLHKDTYKFNQIITNPFKLHHWIEQNGGLKQSELVIMLPGSSWNSQTGFDVKVLDPFINVEQKLVEYKERKENKLSESYLFEASQDLNPKIIAKHEMHLSHIPYILRICLKKITIAYKVIKDEHHEFYFNIELTKGSVVETTREAYQQALVKIDWPIYVFIQAIHLKMYSHAFISKRIMFQVDNDKNIRKLKYYLSFLELIEHEVFPLKWGYFKRFVAAYLQRWREVVVYISVFKQVFINKKSLGAVEEVVLRRTGNR